MPTRELGQMDQSLDVLAAASESLRDLTGVGAGVDEVQDATLDRAEVAAIRDGSRAQDTNPTRTCAGR